ncbi:MAG TPA: iron export ABC transporter permease subunit FetB [Candidatus Hydrogenedentes bacterium]|nr:iron export ABC transporter permease subunit FetB [Candidatus Hydrogenedentota bacterium]
MNSPEASGAIPLGAADVSIAAALILLAAGVSLALRLHLERRLALAAVRTVVQLLLIGYVLKWVFDLEWFVAVVAVAFVMVLAASRAAVQRPSRTFHGATWRAFVSLVVCGFLTTVFVTGVVVGKRPWYAPQYFIPLLGMVLGNGLTGISLCLDHLLESLVERRGEVEMELAHGATRWEAGRDPLADAVRRGMIPIINSMMVVGIVALPGMMTGQILAGANPIEAVKYQIVVMFMIAGATSFGCIMTALLAYRRLFNARHQLEVGLISFQEERH